MTEQERNEYRVRMHAAKTNEEREQIRMEHHERMTKRANAQGWSLPGTPAPKGSFKRSGGGLGGWERQKILTSPLDNDVRKLFVVHQHA